MDSISKDAAARESHYQRKNKNDVKKRSNHCKCDAKNQAGQHSKDHNSYEIKDNFWSTFWLIRHILPFQASFRLFFKMCLFSGGSKFSIYLIPYDYHKAIKGDAKIKRVMISRNSLFITIDMAPYLLHK